MPRTRLLLGLIPLAPLPFVLFACGDSGVARLGLVMESPEGLLDSATGVKLSVFPVGSTKCEASGNVTAIPKNAQAFDLQKSGCAAGLSWCKTIELDKDGSTKMFAVVATGAAGTVAQGCASAKIDQDPLDVSIKVQRYNPPKCCNDGMLQAGEQCDLGPSAQSQFQCDGVTMGGQCLGITPDSVCECDCQATEIPVDRPAGVTTAPMPMTKTQPALAFGPGSMMKDPNNGLRTAFTDTAAGVQGGSDVDIRVLKEDLYPITSSVLMKPLRIPVLCSNTTGVGSVQIQQHPSIATIASNTAGVVYESNEKQAGRFDVFFSAQGDAGCADLAPVQVNTSTTGNSNLPDIAAGPSGTGLVVWTTDAGQVIARIVTPTGPMGNEIMVANGTAAKVGGSAAGWSVIYQGTGSGDGDGVFMRTVSGTGTLGTETLVNAVTQGLQDQPDIAMLDDGRTIAAWRNGGDIFFQRFDKSGSVITGDQQSAINTHGTGQEANPAVAGFGNLFVVAWENGADGTISARLAGGDAGFLFNSVSGQNDDFVATHPAIMGTRKNPAVAIGGAGFIAIGWEDDSTDHPGVFVRRFPLPAQ